MMLEPALVILAAGIGSRYGGAKQLEAVGPGGATLMDYSIYDAARAGFRRIVFVVRPDLEASLRTLVQDRYGARIDARVALQRLDDVPAGVLVPAARAKPWGTGQAVLAAEPEIRGPFVMVNADDFYGRDAFVKAAEFLRSAEAGPPALFGVTAYALRETLSGAGGVNRAICRVNGDGWLDTVEEVVDIRRRADGSHAGFDPRGRAVPVPDDALVSMNMWAFTPAVFDLLRRGFAEFLRQPGATQGEFLIPDAMREVMRRGEARVRLLRARSRWLGITYPEDRPGVAAALQELVAGGEYPERLWG